VNVHDVPLLQCPETGAPLVFHGTNLELQVHDGVLVCEESGTAWGVDQGVARLLRDRWVSPEEAAVAQRLERAPLWMEPAFAAMSLAVGAGRAADFRERVVHKLQLAQLAGRERARVLEIGMGTGANAEPVLDNCPEGTRLEFWGTELSPSAIALARERLEANPEWAARMSFFMADSAHLPFADGIFDRVLIAGGVDCFGDAARSLAEALRVCADDGLVVVVDKQADPSNPPGPLARAVLARLAAQTVRPQSVPHDAIPDGVEVVEESQLTPVHYCLRLRPQRG
jgi:ubiquinone/menaquinone biosynthesis C-methylase UbiE/uncharacterized protein YbaR (Trm112 family)